ncbi:phosphate transport system permease protein PstC [Candidatus Mycoplasma haematohominis]|uniref:Phosphate transport system permease protein PstC n=1 Tax=Candidatus Mycoplasma haematohominis TaxID=1494318 RepID=A0A478FSR2_9MOLU|nr:phosphate transport system permease protein PstC [Candidatus Mycoplasma haemohominis]
MEIDINPRSSSKIADSLTKSIGLLSTFTIWVLIVIFFGYIAYKGIAGAFSYGFKSLFFSLDFDITNNKVSFWAPFGITIFLALLTVLISIPIALRCSIWINFYCPTKYRKLISTILLILANVPSVVLAFYIRRYISPVAHKALFLNTSSNLVVAAIALVCMILPLIIVLFNSVLENKKSWIISAELLGLDKNYAIHKIVIPKIKHTIVIALSLVVGRVISESIMLSMLLSSENYQQSYGNGFSGFINSQSNSVSALIGENYFSDGSSEDVQNLMFLFGGLIFLVSLTFNTFCMEWVKMDREKVNNTSKISFFKKAKDKINWWILCCLFSSCKEWENNECSTGDFIHKAQTKNLKTFFGLIRRGLEFLCLGLFVLYAFSLPITVLIGGIKSFVSDASFVPSQNDTLFRAINNTFLIVLLSILFAAPIAFFASCYVSEYLSNKRFKKYTLALINAAAATPSIIFGIFGLFVFIQTLGWTASGSSGKSLLAGMLTMVLFILPYLTHSFYTYLSGISDNYRESSYILGISKCRTFWKILLPIAFNNLVFSVLLTTGKIIGETAPLYLTAGLNSAPKTLFMYQGQTLTTRIYSQLYESNLAKSEKIINETTFYCLLFISVIVIIAKYGLGILSYEFWKKKFQSFNFLVH